MFELTQENAAAYLSRRLGATGWRIRPLGGGVSNTVLRAESANRALVVKQSLPKLRVEEDWPADRNRIRREWLALERLAPVLPPGRVPELVFTDEENYLFAMSAAPRDARTWKDHLLAGEADPRVAEAVAGTQAAMVNASWNSSRWEALFGDQTAFDQLRLDPYYRFTAGRHRDLKPRFDAEIENALSRRHCLVHGDWSPKNFLVYDGEVLAIDFEVIHYGDPAFDVAFLMNHLLLKSFHHPRWVRRYADLAERYWQTLIASLEADAGWLEQATLGHLGCLLLARIDGKSPAEYIREEAERERVRRFARALIERPGDSLLDVFSRL